MRGLATLRELRQLAHLPLRRETIYHLALNPQGPEPPTLNRLIACDPALAVAALRWTPRHLREALPAIPQIARFVTPRALFDLVKWSQENRPVGDAGEAAIDRVWIHSLAIAFAVRQLSRTTHYKHPHTAFLAGLLHNLGMLAIAAVAPESLQEVLAGDACVIGDPAAEKARFGAGHTTIGVQLAKSWSLPRWLTDVVRWHHQPDGLPSDLTDRALIQVIQQSDELVSQGDFAIASSVDSSDWGLPWKINDPLRAPIARGVRQSVRFLGDHPLRSRTASSDVLVKRTVDVAAQNAMLRAEFDWQSHAWRQFQQLPPDATPGDLTALVAETFSEALGALGALCYIRNSDGSGAEGTFWCDGPRPISCALEPGGIKPHGEQVVATLRPTWQQRPFHAFDLESGDETLAHVLIWVDDFAAAAPDETVETVKTLCSTWLRNVAHLAGLEAQVDSLGAALRDQADQADLRLEQAKLAALAELAAGAGHEFNNPLAVISGRAQLLLAEDTDPRRRKALETIVAQAQRIHRMIVDLMCFARPPEPERKPIAIAELVNRAIATVERDAETLKIALTTALPADLPPIDGDMSQLAAAIECVLRNSLEATPPDGSVQLSVSTANSGTIEIKIADTGHGITQEQRQHIFEPFYSGRDAGRGLGMGLPKAWRIMRNHNGDIQIESATTGTGTVVTLRLPALAANGQQRECA